MPINSQHPLYVANRARWKRCRDCYDGEDAVKAAGIEYLPKIDPSQSDAAYQAYKKRAPYYEAVARTVDGFIGAISRKPHHIQLPESLAGLRAKATADNTTLDDFIKQLCCETLLLARGGMVVDIDDDTQMPYLAFYPAEAILNWGPDWVTLLETIYESEGGDKYQLSPKSQIRHMCIKNGCYVVETWLQKPNPTGAAEWSRTSEEIPTKRGTALARMPFFWLSTSGAGADVSKPPLLGLVNTSLSHYRSAADLEHGRHFTALPTLYLSGITDDDPVCVGAGAVIKLSDPAAKAGYAEFTGQGLQSLETALTTKEQQMAMLGASIMAAGPKGVEAAETARIRISGENSLLLGVVSTVEQALAAALRFAAAWVAPAQDAGDEVVIRLNRDFIDQQLDAQSLTGLLSAVQAGKLSLEDFLFALQQAELLRPETDIAVEAEKLRGADKPGMGPGAVVTDKAPSEMA